LNEATNMKPVIVEEHTMKRRRSTSRERTPLSMTSGGGTASPVPFSNRWGFATDGTDHDDTTPVMDATPIAENDNSGQFDDVHTGVDSIENGLDEDDLVWNGYLDKYQHEPTKPSQLQSFSKNADKLKTLSFKSAKQVFTDRTGKGRITAETENK